VDHLAESAAAEVDAYLTALDHDDVHNIDAAL
jgi:hypothetical protein